MMEVIGKYILETHEEPDMLVRNFKWEADESQAILEWSWPTNPKVKLMMVFPLEEDEESDIAEFLRYDHDHIVVSRNLSAKFQGTIASGRQSQSFTICPAYFNEDNTVVVYKPEYTTDKIYKKNRLTAKINAKPLHFSRYKQVTLDINIPSKLADKAIKYGIYENNKLIGIYPLDNDVIAGKYTINIRKSQNIRFMVDEKYTNQIEIEQGV